MSCKHTQEPMWISQSLSLSLLFKKQKSNWIWQGVKLLSSNQSRLRQRKEGGGKRRGWLTVQPLVSWRSISAPLSSKSWTISSLPSLAAYIREVMWYLSAAISTGKYSVHRMLSISCMAYMSPRASTVCIVKVINIMYGSCVSMCKYSMHCTCYQYHARLMHLHVQVVCAIHVTNIMYNLCVSMELVFY